MSSFFMVSGSALVPVQYYWWCLVKSRWQNWQEFRSARLLWSIVILTLPRIIWPKKWWPVLCCQKQSYYIAFSDLVFKITKSLHGLQWIWRKEQLKRWVFRHFQKAVSDGADVTYCSRVLHSCQSYINCLWRPCGVCAQYLYSFASSVNVSVLNRTVVLYFSSRFAVMDRCLFLYFHWAKLSLGIYVSNVWCACFFLINLEIITTRYYESLEMFVVWAYLDQVSSL